MEGGMSYFVWNKIDRAAVNHYLFYAYLIKLKVEFGFWRYRRAIADVTSLFSSFFKRWLSRPQVLPFIPFIPFIPIVLFPKQALNFSSHFSISCCF